MDIVTINQITAMPIPRPTSPPHPTPDVATERPASKQAIDATAQSSAQMQSYNSQGAVTNMLLVQSNFRTQA